MEIVNYQSLRDLMYYCKYLGEVYVFSWERTWRWTKESFGETKTSCFGINAAFYSFFSHVFQGFINIS